jgi:1,4-dihydroxy-2-naphthoate polyprenyltransferase
MSARAWFGAARPGTLWAGAVPVAVGNAIAAAEQPLDWAVAAATLCVALSLQLASNFINDVADGERGLDGPERLGPPRAMAMGWLTGRQLRIATGLCLLLSAASGVWLAAADPVLLGVGAAAVVCAVAYTAGPLPLGYLGLGDVMVWLFFGVVAVCGTAHAQLGAVPPRAVLASVAIGALATAILVVNNLRDRENDARKQKWTLAARFGERFARIEHSLLFAIAFTCVAAVAIDDAPGWWLPWLALPSAVWITLKVWRRDGTDLNPLLGATARLELGFGLLLCVGVLL